MAGFIDDLRKEIKLKIRQLNRFEEQATPYMPTEIISKMIKKTKEPAFREKDLVLDWNTIFGWKSNPFVAKVLKPIDTFFVDEKKGRRVINTFFIRGFEFGTIKGSKGTGKTTLLRWMRWELRKYSERIVPCYVDASKGFKEEVDLIREIINPLVNVYEKTVLKPEYQINARNIENFLIQKIGQKNFVLIIDEVDKIPVKLLPIIERLRHSNIKLQLIISGNKEELRNFNKFNTANYKDMLKIEIKGMEFERAREMVKKRIEYYGGHDIFPFDNQKLKRLLEKSFGNPNKFLKLCYAKAIQLSLLHKDKLIQMRKEMELQRMEEERKIELEEEKLLDEEEKKRAEEKRKIAERSERDDEYARKYEEEIAKIDARSISDDDKIIDKIDDMINSELGNAFSDDKKEIDNDSSNEDELSKNEDLIQDIVKESVKEDLQNKQELNEEDEDVMKKEEQLIAEITKVIPDVDGKRDKKQKNIKKHDDFIEKLDLQFSKKKTITKKKVIKKKNPSKKTKTHKKHKKTQKRNHKKKNTKKR